MNLTDVYKNEFVKKTLIWQASAVQNTERKLRCDRSAYFVPCRQKNVYKKRLYWASLPDENGIAEMQRYAKVSLHHNGNNNSDIKPYGTH